MTTTTIKKNAVATIKATVEPMFTGGRFPAWGLHLAIKPGQNVDAWDTKNVDGMWLCFNDMGRALEEVAILNAGRKLIGKPLFEIV